MAERRYIPSDAVNSGRNNENVTYKDNRYVKCRKCGFVCHLDRDQRAPRYSGAGDGVAVPSTTLDGDISAGDTTLTVDSATGFATPSTGSITALADAGQRQEKVTVTSSAHGLAEGTMMIITSTTSYNGTFRIVDVTTDTFNIYAPFVADDATGTWTVPEYLYIVTSGIRDRITYTAISSNDFTVLDVGYDHDDEDDILGDIVVSKGCSFCGCLVYDTYEKDD